jgi:two-component system, cell cycle response regulator DivK
MRPEELHLVIIEDNIDNRFIIQEMLRRDLGVKSVVAIGAGWQFFKHLREHRDQQIDMILLDIQLPGDDGYAILQRIRETPALTDTTVIAVTANVMRQDVERARAAGFNGFIGKPIDRRRFPEQIRRILAGEDVWEMMRG